MFTTTSFNHQCWALVTEDNTLVGYGELDEETYDLGVLRRLIINPEKRGKGYGKELVSALLDKAWDFHVPTVELDVSVPNVNATKCYVSCGFQVVSVDPAPDRPWDRYRMRVSNPLFM